MRESSRAAPPVSPFRGRDTSVIGASRQRLDPYVGFACDIADTNWSYDIGYWRYHFPGAESDLDYGEAYGSVTYGLENLDLAVSLYYAEDYFGDDFFGSGSSLAYHGKLTYRFADRTAFSARVGRQTFDEHEALTDQDYVYYDLGVSIPWIGFTLDLRWHDTQGVEADLAPAELTDGRLVARISRGF